MVWFNGVVWYCFVLCLIAAQRERGLGQERSSAAVFSTLVSNAQSWFLNLSIIRPSCVGGWCCLALPLERIFRRICIFLVCLLYFSRVSFFNLQLRRSDFSSKRKPLPLGARGRVQKGFG